jgi:ubiquinone/menaquinone biosynthesis C-methylase UbiE
VLENTFSGRFGCLIPQRKTAGAGNWFQWFCVFTLYMNAIQSIRKIFVPSNRVQSDVDPAVAYDIWAKTYDNQPHNLMLHLDEQVFSELLLGMDLHEKHVIDVGCGTGRHWKTILSQKPVRLQGFDVSANMLHALKQKFPSAETVHTNDELLDTVESHSVDVIISTLNNCTCE